jgi:hypothetical protein
MSVADPECLDRIPDVYTGSRIQGQKDLGSVEKNLRILTSQKALGIKNPHVQPGSGFFYPGSTGQNTPDPDPKHRGMACFVTRDGLENVGVS